MIKCVDIICGFSIREKNSSYRLVNIEYKIRILDEVHPEPEWKTVRLPRMQNLRKKNIFFTFHFAVNLSSEKLYNLCNNGLSLIENSCPFLIKVSFH